MFLGEWIQNSFVNFPAGTLTTNTIGSFFLGKYLEAINSWKC
jgi:fluoride ion exporter CrcB/FEX